MSSNLSDLKFNATEIQPTSFDVIPAGEYRACIVDSMVQATKTGTGKFLNLEISILSGPHAGRKVFDRLNIWNPSPKAVEIAKATLSAICRAVGVLTPKDSQELHNRPLIIKLGVRNDPQFGDSNEVKAYKRANVDPTEEVLLPGQKAPDDEIPF